MKDLRFGLWACFVLATACATSASTSATGGAPPLAGGADEPKETMTAGAGDNPAATEQAGALPSKEGNPFLGARFLIDPDYVAKVESSASAAASPADAALLRRVAAFPTAVWLDNIAAAASASRWLDEARKQEKAAGQPVVTVFVVYDLPNRDCSAAASGGELTAANGGEARYRKEFIDKIAAQFKAHPAQRIVALLEPDSLPNLATNMNVPNCAASDGLYRRATAYAISKLSLPNVSIYLDAAHAGWLGWDANRGKIAQINKEVLDAAGGDDKIRGFFTNVSNYNVLRGEANRKLEPSNPCPDESSYIHELAETLMWAGIKHKGYIIDTSRNGRDDLRTKWGNWCNVRGAGLGERPRAAPSPLLDAYYWVKPPGDSDGTSDPAAPRADANCRSADAAPGAPQAGKWFSPYFIELAKNANPAL